MNRIVIEKENGIVVAIHSEEDVIIDLVDWDALKGGDAISTTDDGVMWIKGIEEKAFELKRIELWEKYGRKQNDLSEIS